MKEQKSDEVCVHQCEYVMKFRRSNQIHLSKTEIEASEGIFIAEHMLGGRSNHIFVNSFNTFMRCV